MRLLHTSDWHLGKRLFDRDRYEVFEKFLDWLLENIRLQKVDALIVAGDIFDTAVPTNRSQKLYYDFLSKVQKAGCRHVVIVAGNHDSPTGIDAPKQYLKNQGIYVIGQAGSPEEEVFELKDENGQTEAVVCAVPFLRERDIDPLSPDSEDSRDAQVQKTLQRHYSEVVKKAEEKMSGKKVPLIATGHLFAGGAKPAKDENDLYIGTVGQVPGSIFPKEIDYLALGHIHGPYVVDRDITRNYSGAPLIFNFDEIGKERIVRIVDFADGKTDVENLVVPTFDDLRRIQGTVPEIKQALEDLKKKAEEKLRSNPEQKQEILVEVIHNGTDTAGDLLGLVRGEEMPGNVVFVRIYDENKKVPDLSAQVDEDFISVLDWKNVFEKRIEEEPPEEEVTPKQLWDAYKTAYSEINETADVNAQ